LRSGPVFADQVTQNRERRGAADEGDGDETDLEETAVAPERVDQRGEAGVGGENGGAGGLAQLEAELAREYEDGDETEKEHGPGVGEDRAAALGEVLLQGDRRAVDAHGQFERGEPADGGVEAGAGERELDEEQEHVEEARQEAVIAFHWMEPEGIDQRPAYVEAVIAPDPAVEPLADRHADAEEDAASRDEEVDHDDEHDDHRPLAAPYGHVLGQAVVE